MKKKLELHQDQACKIKVAFILRSNISSVGGSEKALYEYCKNYPSDFDITIIQLDHPLGPNYYIKEELEQKGVKFIEYKDYIYKFSFLRSFPLGTLFLNSIIYPLYNFIIGRLQLSKIKDNLKKLDMVYLLTNNQANLIPKGPIIVGCTHNWTPKKGGLLTRFTTKLVSSGILWHKIDYFHVFSGFNWFLEKFSKKGFVLDNGVNDNEIGYHVKQNLGNLLFYANLEECKGTRIVLQSFKRTKVAIPDLKLRVAGKGSLSEFVSAQQDVEYDGFASNSYLSRLRSESDCLVYPSSCDVLSLVVLECLAGGLYAIVSDKFKGMFDEFEKIGILHYVEPNVNNLSTAIEQYMAAPPDPATRYASVRLIETKYTWKYISKELFSNFRDILQK
jgi:glycosyltransferase involved in cell wall biosynthesis